jgi:predicted nucleic acid-binding protein
MLVDLTVYIDLLWRGEDIPYILRPYLLSGQLFTCGVIRAEVLRGIRTIEMRNELSELFDLMVEVPTDARIWGKGTDLAWKLDRRGAVLPLTDLVIACCAFAVDTAVVTTDPHFSQISGLKVRQTLFWARHSPKFAIKPPEAIFRAAHPVSDLKTGRSLARCPRRSRWGPSGISDSTGEQKFNTARYVEPYSWAVNGEPP